MSLYLKLVLAEIGDLQQACSHSVIPRCVCVSLVMVWRIMSPVYCVTQISFYRSAHSRRNTHITPHTYHPVLLLLTLIDTLSSPHTYSPLTCFSFSNLKGKKATRKAFLKFPHTHSRLCAKITLFFFFLMPSGYMRIKSELGFCLFEFMKLMQNFRAVAIFQHFSVI